MTDGNGDTPKTPIELQMEAIEKQMADMKAEYETKLKEYQDANKGLWAELHKVPEAQNDPEPEPEKEGFDMDKAVASFNAYYGIKPAKTGSE